MYSYKPTKERTIEEYRNLKPEEMFYRVERQTLRRLPKTKCILFTIKTYQRDCTFFKGKPFHSKKLVEAFENTENYHLAYKEIHLWGKSLFSFLKEQYQNKSYL